jgi:Flp pilus assembly protein TadD
MSGTRLIRVGVALAIMAVMLTGCVASREQQALHSSTLKGDDPLFYPSDSHLKRAKIYFHNQQYGLAEENYRKAVEQSPDDVEAWLGLAASLDHLRRFDLSENAYERVLVLGKDNAIVLNNAGYSQLLRGNIPSARRFLLRAYELQPENPYIINNLKLLAESGEQIKRADQKEEAQL